METLVVGAGAMGRWFGAVALEGPAESLAFVDTDPSATREASQLLDQSTTTRTPDEIQASDERYDIVCIAVPIPHVRTVIEEYGDVARTALIDVTGTMAEPVEAMAAFDHCERASFHPLFAPDNEPGNVPYVRIDGKSTVDSIVDAISARGNTVFETSVAEHDEAMKTVQARTHAAILAFGLAGEPVPDGFQTPVSAPLIDLLERVTAGNPGVYADIQARFDGATDVTRAANRIQDAEDVEFATLYEEIQTRWSDDGSDPEESGE